jgi:hydrogenase maturation factor HypF (carbamoyltransferase family)
LKIIIIGKVHNVGYRLFLLEEADSMFIPNFDAKNVKQNGKEVLIVLIDGEKEQIQEFLEIVKSKKPEGAVIESIKEEEYGGRIREIKSFRESLNTAQLNKIVQTGLTMIEKQDIMIEKQDETKKEIRHGFNTISSKIDRTNELLDRRFANMEREIEKIKKALAKAGIEIS